NSFVRIAPDGLAELVDAEWLDLSQPMQVLAAAERLSAVVLLCMPLTQPGISGNFVRHRHIPLADACSARERASRHPLRDVPGTRCGRGMAPCPAEASSMSRE